MKKKFIQTNFAIILFLPALSFCSGQENQPSAMTKFGQQVVETYQYAAPIIYDTSAQILTSSGEFVRTNIIPLFQPHNKLQTQSTNSIADDFEDARLNVYFEQFADDYRTGALEASLKIDATETTNQLNIVMRDFFKKDNDLESITVQENIFQTFSIAESLSAKTERELELAKAFAYEYNKLQDPVLTALITNHAQKIEPALKQHRDKTIENSNAKRASCIQISNAKREATIKAATALCQTETAPAESLCAQETTNAQQLYRTEMERKRNFAEKVAFNKHYLQKKSGEKHNINLDDYKVLDKYLVLLTSKQAK